MLNVCSMNTNNDSLAVTADWMSVDSQERHGLVVRPRNDKDIRREWWEQLCETHVWPLKIARHVLDAQTILV